MRWCREKDCCKHFHVLSSTTRTLKAENENGVYSADTLKLVCFAVYLRRSHTEYDDNGQAGPPQKRVTFHPVDLTE